MELDRAQAAAHYVGQAQEALAIVLARCEWTYGQDAAKKAALMFTQLFFGHNLPLYCEPNEVLTLFNTISTTAISPKVWGGEFIMGLSQQFNMFVEPAVQYPHVKSPADQQPKLTELGWHLVAAMTGMHGDTPKDVDQDLVHPYGHYMLDVPKAYQVTTILFNFPWMTPLYLLSLADPAHISVIVGPYGSRDIPAGSEQDGA
jgi:hypothetical protein